MRMNAMSIVLTVVALMAGVSCASVSVYGQDANGATSADTSGPIAGTWKLDLDKSVNNRNGKEVHPTRPSTRIFAVEGDRYRMSVIDDGGTAPARSYFARFDGKEYPDPHGPGRGEVAIHWELSPYMIVRLVKKNGKPTEWVTYAVSSDGNILTTTSWDPANPEYHNVSVYEREK